jgi:hypothetical protein
MHENYTAVKAKISRVAVLANICGDWLAYSTFGASSLGVYKILRPVDATSA